MGFSAQRRAALIALSLTMTLGAALSCTLNTSGVEANSSGPASPSGAPGVSTEGSGGSTGASSQSGGDTNGAGGAGGTSETTGAGGNGGAPPECGDGILTPPEACDDSNTDDGDTCTSDCSCGINDPNSEAHTRPDDGHCYVLVKTPLRGVEALGYCFNQGTRLAAINSDSERSFVGSFLGAFTWLGGTDAFGEGKWAWVNGEPWNIAPCNAASPSCDNNVKLWNDNEPNGGTDENCLQFVGDQDKFNDSNCDQKHPFLCEKAP